MYVKRAQLKVTKNELSVGCYSIFNLTACQQ
jgi:hypothetical protein